MAHARVRPGRTDEGGAALVAAVLLTLALFALAHGMLTLALAEVAASRAGLRHLEARVAAERVVYDALAGPVPAWMDSLGIGGERTLATRTFGRAEGETSLRRLAEESWWLEGAARVGFAETRSARLGWALDPLTRVVSFSGVVAVGAGAPMVLAGAVTADSATAIADPLASTDCDPWRSALGAHYLAQPLAAIATLPGSDTLPSLGLLDWASLLDRADVMVSGSGVPTPADAAGVCATTEAWNWGDPDRRWRPCGSYLALRGASGPLEVTGGAGQGVLLVDGDLTLRGNTRYYGLVLARGALRLEDESSLDGFAVAAGGVYVAGTARIRGSACWAARALAAQRATLGRPLIVPGVGPMGPL